MTKIYSMAGQLKPETELITECPFCSPHNTISDVVLTGSGQYILPGEVTMGHRVLLLSPLELEYPGLL